MDDIENCPMYGFAKRGGKLYMGRCGLGFSSGLYDAMIWARCGARLTQVEIGVCCDESSGS